MIDTKALRQLAEKATPGPWNIVITNDEGFLGARYISNGCNDDGKMLMEGGVDNESVIAITLLQSPALACNERCEHNSQFIALANPQTILQLLDRLDKLEAVAVESRRFNQHIAESEDQFVDMDCEAYDAFHDALAALDGATP